MEIHPSLNKYMDCYYDFLGQWDSPSRCGLKIIKRKDGKTLAIATEIYRLNPGTPVTEWCAPLATQIMKEQNCTPGRFIFVEHTPDMGSKLDFYDETFDLVSFQVADGNLTNPQWKRLSTAEVDDLMAG